MYPRKFVRKCKAYFLFKLFIGWKCFEHLDITCDPNINGLQNGCHSTSFTCKCYFPCNCRLNSLGNIIKFLQQELIHKAFQCSKIEVEHNSHSEKFQLSTLRLKRSNKTI